VLACDRGLRYGCRNGFEGFRPRIREATRSHASGSPSPSEDMDVRAARPDGEKWIVLMRDQRLRHRALEIQALRNARVGAFVLTAGQATARCPALGCAASTSPRRHSYQPHTNAGSRSNAYGVASSAASNCSHRPVCLSRKVGIPLSADTPAPVRTVTRVAARSAVMRLSGNSYWVTGEARFAGHS